MFLREARTVAKLSHPHIVRVHEIGREGGSVYIVSEFVDGVSLAEYIAQQPPSIRESAQLCAIIAKSIHYAHEQGVVHRDLKPTNVMINRQGRPHIMDFGLAKREANELTVTTDGEILGTPAYMSPEQAAGESHAADRRSDVYSIGVMLFQLMTGELPFRGSFEKLIKQIIHDPPPRPANSMGAYPEISETICLKALEKRPQRRYGTAADLAADLENWLGGLPIRARSVGPLGRLIRYCGRQPWTAASWLAAILSVILLVTGICRVTLKREHRLQRTLATIDDFSHVQQSSQHLQAAAENQELKLLLAARDLDGLQQFCRSRVETTMPDHADGAHFASWFVLDDQGRLLAVSPQKQNIVGSDFSHRDYFLGAQQRRPAMGVSAIHISRVFLSTNDGLYKFAISAAVRDKDDRLLGVVVASLATDSSTAIELDQALTHDLIVWGLLGAALPGPLGSVMGRLRPGKAGDTWQRESTTAHEMKRRPANHSITSKRSAPSVRRHGGQFRTPTFMADRRFDENATGTPCPPRPPRPSPSSRNRLLVGT